MAIPSCTVCTILRNSWNLVCYVIIIPLDVPPISKRLFLNQFTSFSFFFLVTVTFLKWITCISNSTIYLPFNKHGQHPWYFIHSLLRTTNRWIPMDLVSLNFLNTSEIFQYLFSLLILSVTSVFFFFGHHVSYSSSYFSISSAFFSLTC